MGGGIIILTGGSGTLVGGAVITGGISCGISCIPKSEPITKPEPIEKPKTTPETKPETVPTTKPKTKPETKPKTKPETKPKAKPETRPVPRPKTKPKKQCDGKPCKVGKDDLTYGGTKPWDDGRMTSGPILIKPKIYPRVIGQTNMSFNL